jgi:hypothetical protein
LSAKGRQAEDAIEALAQQFDTEFGIEYKE